MNKLKLKAKQTSKYYDLTEKPQENKRVFKVVKDDLTLYACLEKANGINKILPKTYEFDYSYIVYEEKEYEAGKVKSAIPKVIELKDEREELDSYSCWNNGCNVLKDITAVYLGKNGIIKASNSGFLSGNDNLKTFIVSEGVTDMQPDSNIDKYTMVTNFCKNLTNVYLPTTLTKLPAQTFNYAGIKELDLSNSNVSIVENNAVYYCEQLTKIKFNDKLTKIGQNSFYWGPEVIELDLGNNVTELPNNSIYNMPKLTSFNFGKKLTYIGNSVFYNCDLRVIDLPETIQKIDYAAFQNNPNLKTVIVRATTPPLLLTNAFGSTPVGQNPDSPVQEIFVPAEALDAYLNDSIWGALKDKIKVIEE